MNELPAPGERATATPSATDSKIGAELVSKRSPRCRCMSMSPGQT